MEELGGGEGVGRPFRQILREWVLDPIGMSNSTYEQPLPAALEKQAAHAHSGGGRAMNAKWHVYPEMAAAGLWATPTDLAKLLIRGRARLLGQSSRVAPQRHLPERMT